MNALTISELVDRIVDYLHEDKPSLRSTSLVARLWTSASQHHLLETIHICQAGGVRALFADLKARNHFKLCIVTLRVDSVVVGSLSTLCAVIDLAHALPRLQALSFTNLFLSRAMEEPIPLLHGRKALCSLEFRDCDMKDGAYATALIQSFSSIDRLIMHNSELVRGGWDTSALVQFSTINVNHLVLYDDAWVDTSWQALLLLSMLSENSPRHLSVTLYTSYSRTPEAARLWAVMGARLDTLEVSIPGWAGTSSALLIILVRLNLHLLADLINDPGLLTPNLRVFRAKLLCSAAVNSAEAPLVVLADCVGHLCHHLALGQESNRLELMEYDMRGLDPNARNRTTSSQVISAAGHNGSRVDVIFDEAELLPYENYRQPEDLIQLIHSRHRRIPYKFHTLD